ncbi:MAG: two-component sensor histidine kinase [Magnetovibrio sp.]|nr:two-component sensor histidine kinase [Magnetovibrio sp.]
MTTVATAAILQALPDPVLLIDGKKTIVSANDAAKNLLGAQIEGRSLVLALRQPEVLDAVNDVLGGEDHRSAHISLMTSVRRSFDIQVTTLEAAAQSNARAVLIMHDITAARNAEQMRADFVTNVSHELRSPLSSLVGFIETLRGPARDDESARDRFLDLMDSESKRMARLIDDLLSLSRVEANEHILPDGQVELRALLADVTDALSMRANGRSLTISFARDGASVFAPGDWDELTEVFHNLIDNAVKYCPEHTKVRVEIDEIERIPEIGLPGVVIAIANEGDGIPAEHLPRLTERFYRVDKGRSRTMGGTGLGLAIVKHIVNRHRGQLTVDSALGQGTVFKVFLPSVRDVAESDDLSQY